MSAFVPDRYTRVCSEMTRVLRRVTRPVPIAIHEQRVRRLVMIVDEPDSRIAGLPPSDLPDGRDAHSMDASGDRKPDVRSRFRARNSSAGNAKRTAREPRHGPE